MALDEKEFVTEVNAAIDVMEESEKNESDAGNATDSEGKADEVAGGESNEASIEGSAKMDDGLGEEKGAETPEGHINNNEGSAEEEGDREGDRDLGKDSGTEKVTISDYAIEQAVAVGVPLGDAVAFRSDESLLRVVEARRRVATADVPKAGEVKEETVNDVLAAIPELDPEKFEPETVEMFKALKGVIKQQQESIANIYEQQGVSDSMNREASAREVEVWFDREVDDLGEDFTEALGKGGYSGLPRGSSQLAKRDEIANHVAVMLSGYAASGIEAPARSEVFKTAIRSVLHDEFRQQDNKGVAKKLEKRSAQHTQRAGGKSANNHLSPEDETAELLDRKFPQQR